jgi:hypothetical protein
MWRLSEISTEWVGFGGARSISVIAPIRGT